MKVFGFFSRRGSRRAKRSRLSAAGRRHPCRLAATRRHAFVVAIQRARSDQHANVKRLAPAWIFQTGDYEMGLQATPIVIDGVLYLSTSRNHVFALDAATGTIDLAVQVSAAARRGVRYGPQNRGVAVGAGKVFDRHLRRLRGRARSENRPGTVARKRRGFQAMRMQHHRRAAVREG